MTPRKTPTFTFLLFFNTVFALSACVVTNQAKEGTGNLVTNATLTTIQVNPVNPFVMKGLTQLFRATGIYSDGSEQDVTGSAIWVASDPSVAAFSTTAGSESLASALAVGSTTITAIFQSISGATTLNVTNPPSASKEITQFTILGVDGTIGPNTVALTMPFGTDVTALTPIINTTGVNINPANGVAQNFTNPIVYTVTAADGSTKTYIVTVNVALNSAKNITAFEIMGIPADTIGVNTIVLTLPFGTPVTSLTPTTITITGASVTPGVGEPRDFTNP
ncbi:MAG: Ig-like domain-containing protein, partial [Pseudomonadota bacterium]